MQLAAMQHLHPDAALTMVMPDYVELNGFNLASHTTALEQSVLGKPHLLPKHNIVSSMPPTIIGKRSRSNSDASSCHSSSAGSSHASVFSSEIDASDNEYGSQTSIGEQTPCSRKCSMSEGTSSQHSLDDLAVWRAELLAREQSERERCAKRIRDLRGQVVRLASEVVHNASSSHSDAQPAIAVPAAVASISTSSILSASSSSSSTEEKNALVDTLVDAACRTLDLIWNASNPSASCDLAKGKSALPLQVFVRETLRRGRTSCSTLQASLLYCVRLGEAAKRSKQMSLHESTRAAGVSVEVEAQPTSAFHGMTKEELCLVRCPRRMFLASIMVASKFVQDRTYSNRAWSKISGLPLKDLGKLERAFLKAIDYRLMVSEGEWEKWTAQVNGLTEVSGSGVAGRRSNLSRSQSDNVTGAAVALDTELRAASPRLPSQVQPKYRHLDAQPGSAAELALALPFPRAKPSAVAISAEIQSLSSLLVHPTSV